MKKKKKQKSAGYENKIDNFKKSGKLDDSD